MSLWDTQEDLEPNDPNHPLIIGIETSCDETAAGIVDLDGRLHANVVASQADLHARYGGIVPEVASRQHIRDLAVVVNLALENADVGWEKIDAVAVTNGPGLAGSLLTGVNFAKGVAASASKPLIAVNHLAGHVMAAFIRAALSPEEAGGTETHYPVDPALATIDVAPVMCLIVSGGHTELVTAQHKDSHITFELIGQTLDDAAGEAFDKAARAIGLSYPGGPAIQNAAQNADVSSVEALPRAWLPGTHNFSFSGLKTAVLNRASQLDIYPPEMKQDDADPVVVSNVAKAFQDSVVDVLVRKTVRAAEEFECAAIALVGGVAANRPLREAMQQHSHVPVACPPISLCTDNGAMIARAGLDQLTNEEYATFDLDVIPSLRIA